MSRGVRAVLLLVAAALSSGRAATADGPSPQVVSDFEDQAFAYEINSSAGSVEIVEPPPAGGGHALRWTLVPSGPARSRSVSRTSRARMSASASAARAPSGGR